MSIESKVSGDRLAAACKIAGAVVFLALCAKTKINMYPVPFTLQTFAVYFIGFQLSPRDAFIALLSYVSVGLLGIPVFSPATAGFHAAMAMPTFGYIIGMLFAAPLISFLRRKKINQFVACVVGYAVVHTCGVLWLWKLFDAEMSIIFGFFPFVVVDFAKISAAVALSAGHKAFRRFLLNKDK
ncbi:MAG: biotin transporter BioY [Holosporales bacterium]|jgi:biotin transport system substrate-specific component|nr:biotin transporter BioY [Holosporales bacterium]